MAGTIRRFRKRRAGSLKRGIYKRIKRARRNYLKRKTAYRFSKQITMGNFPPRKTVMLKYVSNFSLNPSSSASDVHVFRVNSVYNPDYTASGHQPMFYDNYSTLYQRYKVNYAKITFVCLSQRVSNNTVSNIVGGTSVTNTQYYAANEKCIRMFILRDYEVADYPNNIDTLIEEGNTNFKWRWAPNMTSGKLNKLNFVCVPHKQTNLNFKDDTLTAPIDNNPNTPAYFICGASQIGDSSNPDAMDFQVIISYNVTFYDLKKNQTQN